MQGQTLLSPRLVIGIARLLFLILLLLLLFLLLFLLLLLLTSSTDPELCCSSSISSPALLLSGIHTLWGDNCYNERPRNSVNALCNFLMTSFQTNKKQRENKISTVSLPLPSVYTSNSLKPVVCPSVRPSVRITSGPEWCFSPLQELERG